MNLYLVEFTTAYSQLVRYNTYEAENTAHAMEQVFDLEPTATVATVYKCEPTWDGESAICDICGEQEDHSVGREYNWNGETGNHLSCERYLAWEKKYDGQPISGVSEY